MSCGLPCWSCGEPISAGRHSLNIMQRVFCSDECRVNFRDYAKGAVMILLDTPQWESLSVNEKRLIGTVYGEGDELTTSLTPGAAKMVRNLEERGLITVTWNERDATIRLREEGWK